MTGLDSARDAEAVRAERDQQTFEAFRKRKEAEQAAAEQRVAAERQRAQQQAVAERQHAVEQAAAALSAARGWLSQAQSDLRDSESQFASTCRQIGTRASACQVFYTPNAATALDSSRNQLLLSRDQVAYTSGMVSALECRAR